MTEQKALEILGISSFTAEELANEELKKAKVKKIRQQLAKKYHPDNFPNASKQTTEFYQDKMKEINAAADYFIKFNLELYKEEIISKMKSYYENSKVGDSDLIKEVKDFVKNAIFTLNFRDTKEGVDSIFEAFLRVLRTTYEKFKNKFYENHYIYEEDVKESINYNVCVEDFWKQLLKIDDKYSREVIFFKRVDDEIANYKLYATCTSRVWKLISEVCVHNARLKAENNRYENMEEAIASLHEEINNLFSLVDEINAMFTSIASELLNIQDKSLQEEWERLKLDYDKGKGSLSDTKNGLETLKTKIEEYKKEQIRLVKIKEEEPIVNGLYVEILNNYNKALVSLNPINDNDKIKEITEFFQIVLNLFVRYSSGLLELDRLLMLSEVTFVDLIKDRELVNNIISNKPVTSDKLRIYLKKEKFCNLILDNTCFFVLREEDGKYYIKKLLFFQGMEREINLDDLNREYVSLDEVMKTAIYQGYKALYQDAIDVDVLYEINVGGDYRYFTLDRGMIKIVARETLSDPIANIGYEYNDKEYVKNLIVEQVQKDLNKGEPLKR